MRKYRWIVLATAGLVGLVAVASPLLQGGSAGNLAGTSWTLVELNGEPPVGDTGPITLGFEGANQAGGNSGCNSYGATYVARRTSLRITDLVSTLRACVDPRLNDQEAAYLRALAAVASYQVEGDRLWLRDAAGAVVLVFERG